MNKKLQSKICILLFLLILVGPSIIWVFIKAFDMDLYRRFNYDLGENRDKQKLETVSLTEALSDLDGYVSDRAPFRSPVIELVQSVDSRLDHIYQDDICPLVLSIVYGRDNSAENASVASMDEFFDTTEAPAVTATPAVHSHNYVITAETEPTYTSAGSITYTCNDCGDSYTTIVGKLIDDSYFPPMEYDGYVLRGRYDWLFYTGNESIDYYRGTNLLDEATLEEYAELTRHLQELCDERGIQLALMFMPNKEQVYPEYMPTYEIETDYKRTQRLVDYINDNTDTIAIYPLEELQAADVYHQVYYKYDTHWNHFGAIVGMEALNKAMGRFNLNPATLEGYEENAEMFGDFKLAGLNYADFETDHEFIAAYKVHIALSDIGDIDNVNRIESSYGSNERLVFLGDSFRINMAPFLAKDYTYSTFAHRDYIGQVADDIRNCNVLVISAVERYDSQVFSCIEGAIQILEEEDN